MVSIQKATEFPGVAPQTQRRGERGWEREGRFLPAERTPGGRRRYDLARLRPEQFRTPEMARRTIAPEIACSAAPKPDRAWLNRVRRLSRSLGRKQKGSSKPATRHSD